MAAIPDYSKGLAQLGQGVGGVSNPQSIYTPLNLNVGGAGVPNTGIGPLSLPNLGNVDLGQSSNSLYRPAPMNPAQHGLGNYNGGLPGAAPAGDPSFYDLAFGSSTTDPATGAVTKSNGFVAPLAQGIGAVSSIYFGLKGLDLAEDQFKFQKSAFKKNYEANKLAFNNAVRTKGDARANAVSNEVLGIADNATNAERDVAEKAYSESQSKPRTL